VVGKLVEKALGRDLHDWQILQVLSLPLMGSGGL
jgi:hypothetical protein